MEEFNEPKPRNPLGTILEKSITRQGKKITVYDARKRYTKPDGEKAEKYKRCRTKSEASTALVNFDSEIKQEAIDFYTEKTEVVINTFFDLTNYFRKNYLIEAVIVHGRKIAGYRQPINKLDNMIKEFESFFGDLPVADFNYEKIRSFSLHISTNLKKSKNATEFPKQATINRKLALLRKIFNVCVQLAWIGSNPVSQGKSLIVNSAEEHRNRILTFEEEQRLLAACIGDQTVTYKRKGKEITANNGAVREHLIPIIIMAIDTGMRRGEIMQVERGQINLTNHTISLRPEQTKALKARTMPITARLEKALRDYFSTNFVPKDEPVFGGRAFRKSFDSAVKAAKLNNFVFHDLRHTATTWMDEAGISEAVKKNIVGHSTGDVHQRYNNLSTDILLSAKRKLDDFRAEIDLQLRLKVNAKVNTQKAAHG